MRKVALLKANSMDLYEEFLDDEKLSETCRKFISEQVDDNHRLALDARILPLRLQNLSDPTRIYELARRLDSSTEIANALVNIPVRTVRDEALNLCFDEDVLGELQKTSKQLDKSVNRFVRDRLHALKELRNRSQNLTAQADHVIAAAERSAPNDPHYLTRREKIEREWEHTLVAIEQLNDQLQEHGQDKVDVDSLRVKFPSRADPAAVTAAGPQQFDAILSQLRACENDESEIDECERQWLDALKEQAAPPQTADQFYQLANSKRRQLRDQRVNERHRQEISRLLAPIELKEPGAQSQDWYSVWSTRDAAFSRLRKIDRFVDGLTGQTMSEELTESRTNLKNMAATLQTVVDRCDELEQETMRHVESNLASLDKFIEAGSLKKAKSAERNVIALINRLPKRKQGAFHSSLTPALASIRQLSEWQEFAEEPKRLELCEAIEELAENPLSPEEQFHRIRELREQWNALGILRSRDERTLQVRYDNAAAKAFQLCEAWFQEQAEVRERNLSSRRVICEQLQSFIDGYDWDKPDYKVVHKNLRTAQSEWRSYTPIERSQSKEVNATFNKLTRELEEKLTDHWAENTRQKEKLIQEAKEAVEDASLSPIELISLIKDLQAQWKNVGPAGRRKEQGLWKSFRTQCNSAFELRETQQKERRAQLDANIKLAQDEVAKLSDRIGDSKTTLKQLDSSLLHELRSKFSDIELPARIRKEIDNKMSSLAAQLEKKREELETQRTSGELRTLIDIDLEISKLEVQGLNLTEDLLEKAGTSKEWFTSRNAEDASKKKFVLHELVLRAEVLADVPSPDEDAGKRMQVQVSRLQHGLTRGGESEEQKVERLIQAWCSAAHGEQPLRDRFHFAIRKHLDDLST